MKLLAKAAIREKERKGGGGERARDKHRGFLRDRAYVLPFGRGRSPCGEGGPPEEGRGKGGGGRGGRRTFAVVSVAKSIIVGSHATTLYSNTSFASRHS